MTDSSMLDVYQANVRAVRPRPPHSRIFAVVQSALAEVSAGEMDVEAWHTAIKALRDTLDARVEILLDECTYTPDGMFAELERIYADAAKACGGTTEGDGDGSDGKPGTGVRELK
jgi:hypothetical protein